VPLLPTDIPTSDKAAKDDKNEAFLVKDWDMWMVCNFVSTSKAGPLVYTSTHNTAIQ
jgi:hypothetical protein